MSDYHNPTDEGITTDRKSSITQSLQRKEQGQRTDALALADAISAVVRAAEAMFDAGDLTVPAETATVGWLSPTDQRRAHLHTAVLAMRAIRAGSQSGQTSGEEKQP